MVRREGDPGLSDFRSAHRRKSLALAGALGLLVLLAYLPVLRAGFIWDDDAYVTANLLLTGPDALRRIWFSPHHQSQYFPLVYTTLWLERMLWGLEPAGYHAVNLALHVANALLAWALLRRLQVPAAWLAAAVWAIHPVNVETVAWISELKNTQSTLFYLLALLAWLKFTEAPRSWPAYGAALLACLLALFSKTTTCTLPAAMLIVLWWRHEPIGRRRLLQVVPFVLLGLAMGLLSVWWERHLGNYRDGDAGTGLGGLQKVLIATRAIWFYAGKLFWPADLAFSYPHWNADVRSPAQLVWPLASALVAALLWLRREVWGRAPAAAVAFFVATLAPLLGFIPLYTFRYSYVADHYQYVASLGLVALAVGGGATIGRRAGRWRLGGAVAGCVLLSLLGGLTWKRAHVYRDQETLWRDTLAKNPNGWMPHNNLGMVLAGQRRSAEASAEFRAALQAWPDYADAHYNLGRVLFSQGDYSGARGEFAEAVRMKPGLAEAHDNLGLTLARLGRLPEAIEELRAALRIAPDNTRAANNLGLALLGQNRPAEAAPQFQAVLRVQPGNAGAHNNLAVALAEQGKLAEGIAEWQAAVRIKPNFPEAYLNWGDALAKEGRTAEALATYEQALRLRPDWPPALRALSRAKQPYRESTGRPGSPATPAAHPEPR